MTIIDERQIACGVCGEESPHLVLVSTSQMGYCDLDLRPAELMRSTMPLWVQRCPKCGYCAPDISLADEIAKRVVESDAYQEQLNNPLYPELANSFLCAAMVLENYDGGLAVAGWNALHAAWVCDDEENEMAASCRLKAVDLFEKALSQGETFYEDQPGTREALLTDLLRRAGEFERAKVICEQGLASNPDELISRVLNYQLKLLEAGDTEAHNVFEVAEQE